MKIVTILTANVCMTQSHWGRGKKEQIKERGKKEQIKEL